MNLKSIKPFSRFLLYCSGTNTDLFHKIPTDYRRSEIIKLSSIGATILLTAILASFSGGYALLEVFKELRWAILFGILWGIVIFTIDRNIIISFRYDKDPFNRFLLVFPRLLLAILLAVVIARPLEIRIFEDEINQQLSFNKARLIDTEVANLELELIADSIALTNNIRIYKERFESLETVEKELRRQFGQEKKGTGGTESPGFGPQAKILLDKLNRISEQKTNVLFEIVDLDSIFADLIISTPFRRKQIKLDVEQKIDKSFATSLLAKNKALGELQASDSSIWFSSMLVTILFVLIEIAPIIVKWGSKKTIYDAILSGYEKKELVDKFEASYNYEQFEKLRDLESALDNQTKEVFLREKQEMEKEILADFLKATKSRYQKDKLKNSEKYVQLIYNKLARFFGELEGRMEKKNWKGDEILYLNDSGVIHVDDETADLNVLPAYFLKSKIPVSEKVLERLTLALIADDEKIRFLSLKFPRDENYFEISVELLLASFDFLGQKKDIWSKKKIAGSLVQKIDLNNEPVLKIEFEAGINVIERRLIRILNSVINSKFNSDSFDELLILKSNFIELKIIPILEYYKLMSILNHVRSLRISPAKEKIVIEFNFES